MNDEKTPMSYLSVAQIDVPRSRNGKHHGLVKRILDDLAQLQGGRALRIPLAELGASKEKVRSAVNRESRKRGVLVSTASDDKFFYLWNGASNEQRAA